MISNLIDTQLKSQNKIIPRTLTLVKYDLNKHLKESMLRVEQQVKKEKDFIVVKDYKIARDLIKNYKGKDLKGKTVIVAPDGLEMLSIDELLKLPQVKKYITSLSERSTKG